MCATAIMHVFIVALIATTSTSAHAEPALKLTQKHNYWGDTETIVSMNGLRINNKGRMKYSLVARSPEWDVTVFRDDDKTFLSQNLQQFEKTGLISDYVVKKYSRSVTAPGPVRTGKVGDLATQIFTRPFAELESLPLKNIASPPVEAILYAAYKLPTNGGIPIRFTKIMKGSGSMFSSGSKGTRRNYLITTRIEHTNVATKLFEPPTGYTRCKSMQEVLLSKISRDASGDFDELFKIKDRNNR